MRWRQILLRRKFEIHRQASGPLKKYLYVNARTLFSDYRLKCGVIVNSIITITVSGWPPDKRCNNNYNVRA